MGFVKQIIRGLLSIINFSSPLNPKCKLIKLIEVCYITALVLPTIDAFFFKPEMDLKWCMIGFIVDNHKGDKYAIKYTGEISYKPERIIVP